MTQRTNPRGTPQQQPMRRSRHPTLWVLEDPEVLDLVFQAFEDLTTLRQCCGQKVSKAREKEHLVGPLLWKEDESGLRRWSRLSEIVTTIWNLLDQTVRTNRLDCARCQEAYRQMLWVRMVWTRLESHPGQISLIEHITNHLRQLLIHVAQAHRHRRRVQP